MNQKLKRPVIIFDTSAVNKLAADQEFQVLFGGIKAAYFVRISETNVAEVVATTDPAERKRLLEKFRVLTTEGECILPYNLIIDQGVTHFHNNPASFNWDQWNVRSPVIEHEIVRQRVINDKLA